MPKHALNFKHLLGTVSAQRGAQKDEDRSVTALLERSRAAAAASAATAAGRREAPPHFGEAVSLWEGGDGTESPDSRVGVHPAELARREAVEQRRAARGVAGPAPPRSWRRLAPTDAAAAQPPRQATRADLVVAETFLGHAPPQRTPPSLVDVCLGFTLRLLRDDTVVWDDDDEGGAGQVTMAEAVLAGAVELELHLRAGLVSASAVLPPSVPRLRDSQFRALLEYDAGDGARSTERAEEGDEWESGLDDVRPTLTHLALCAHPSPLPVLRVVPRLRALALTSLDLAFASVPALDRLVAALPPGLRALGIAGLQVKDARSWERGLGVLATRMIVLKILDVSYAAPGTNAVVSALFSGATPNALPSLRRLAIRGGVPDDDAPGRKRLRGLINLGRSRYIDVHFD